MLRSAPLDIVLNPAVVRSVVEFFRLPEDINQSSVLSDRIKAAAFTRYVLIISWSEQIMDQGFTWYVTDSQEDLINVVLYTKSVYLLYLKFPINVRCSHFLEQNQICNSWLGQKSKSVICRSGFNQSSSISRSLKLSQGIIRVEAFSTSAGLCLAGLLLGF